MVDSLSNINHTYLRYECADTFGVSVASGSSKAPTSHQVMKSVPRLSMNHPSLSSSSSSSSSSLLYTIAGSTINVWNMKSSLQPIYRIAHVCDRSNIGTGAALNDNEVVCLDVVTTTTTTTTTHSKKNMATEKTWVATGWIDGTIRIFELDTSSMCLTTNTSSPYNSLLGDHDTTTSTTTTTTTHLWHSDPLVLHGHQQSPVRTIRFDVADAAAALHRDKTTTMAMHSRCASGGSDGIIILWDIIAETGLFRFIGHRGAITDLSFFVAYDHHDLLLSCSVDGLMKVWDIQNQCCIQTLTNYRGHQVLTGTFRSLWPLSPDDHRYRFITGASNGQTMVWSIATAAAAATTLSTTKTISTDKSAMVTIEDTSGVMAPQPDHPPGDDICQFMGTIQPPTNTIATHPDKITCIQFSYDGRYVGIGRGEKLVDVYHVRSLLESHKKRIRRMKRRQEKYNKKQGTENEDGRPAVKKRGILDDDDDNDDHHNDDKDGDETMQPSSVTDYDPELLQASDEFEYLVTIRTTNKIRGFCFSPNENVPQHHHHRQQQQPPIELCRVVCALGSNALETYSIQKRPEPSSEGYVQLLLCFPYVCAIG
jgi:WD40 repeat protein